jgi:hypothetical protein
MNTEAARVTSRKRWQWMPDFFIAGAMKCGTTTLHEMLAKHPGIYIPHGEIFFFDIDDFQNHVNFFAYDGATWKDLDFDANLDEYAAWYQRFFARAQPGQMIGEDSTTYMASARAPARVARFNPDAKIIFMLRDPASRTYSTYWHLLRGGRLWMNFEDVLRLQPEVLVSRSMYREQIEGWLRHFPREQVHFVLLEELVKEPERILTEVCAFLGVPGKLPPEALTMHANRGDAPRSPWLARLRNRILWRRDTRSFFGRLPGPPEHAESWFSRGPLRWLDRLHRKFNNSVKRPPPMKPGTRRFLNQLFQRENRGLSALIGKDVERWWYRE